MVIGMYGVSVVFEIVLIHVLPIFARVQHPQFSRNKIVNEALDL